jgi:hypothetical protein
VARVCRVRALRKGAADNIRRERERPMSIEENKAVVGRWFTEFWGKDFNPAVIDELAAPDIRFEYSLHAPLRGRDAVRAFAGKFRAAFPPLPGRGRKRHLRRHLARVSGVLATPGHAVRRRRSRPVGRGRAGDRVGPDDPAPAMVHDLAARAHHRLCCHRPQARDQPRRRAQPTWPERCHRRRRHLADQPRDCPGDPAAASKLSSVFLAPGPPT